MACCCPFVQPSPTLATSGVPPSVSARIAAICFCACPTIPHTLMHCSLVMKLLAFSAIASMRSLDNCSPLCLYALPRTTPRRTFLGSVFSCEDVLASESPLIGVATGECCCTPSGRFARCRITEATSGGSETGVLSLETVGAALFVSFAACKSSCCDAFPFVTSVLWPTQSSDLVIPAVPGSTSSRSLVSPTEKCATPLHAVFGNELAGFLCGALVEGTSCLSACS